MADDIKKKAVGSLVWTTMQKVLGLGIQFISGIILARLLTPSDYGCIGMLVIFTSVSQVFIDGGFGSALIQKKDANQTDYSTVFYWNMAISLLLYCALFCAAPFIAEFYRMPILSSVLRVQSLILLFSALSTVQLNRLKKQMEFKKIAIIAFFSSIISLTVTIIMAYLGYGVWALVAQYLLMSLIPTLSYIVITRWYPNLIFSWTSFKELFNFGVFVLFTNLINNLGRSLEGLLIGRFYNADTMGLYTKGKSLEGIAMTGVSDALNQVTYPLYAGYQDNKRELINIIRKITLLTAVIMFPFAFCLIIGAKPIFVILYSERWLGSVFYFQVLCLSGIAVSLQGVNSLAIAAIGKSKEMMNYTLGKRIVSIVLLFIGLFAWGMKGLLAAVVFESWFSYFVNAYLVSKHIGYNLKNQIQNLYPILIMSLIAFAASFALLSFININMYADAVIAAAVYIIIYLAIGVITRQDSFTLFRTVIITRMFHKK